jgi:hypothetical protein
MRKFIFAALVFISIAISTSCTPYWFNTEGYKVLSEPLYPTWVNVARPNHKYISMSYWQSPHEFEAAGGGNCVGFAVDLIYYLGEDAEFVPCKTSFCAPGTSHVVVKYKGQYLEPQIWGVTYTVGDGTLISVDDSYSYYSIMQSVTNFGTKSMEPGSSDAYDKIMSYNFTDVPAPGGSK